jgi:hypothetical protein
MIKLKEIGKDIIDGPWGMGIIEVIGALIVGIGLLTAMYPCVMVPVLGVGVAWLIGKYMRRI